MNGLTKIKVEEKTADNQLRITVTTTIDIAKFEEARKDQNLKELRDILSQAWSEALIMWLQQETHRDSYGIHDPKGFLKGKDDE
jgi:hypothetical protein